MDMNATIEIDAADLSDCVMGLVDRAANPPDGATGEDFAFRLGEIRGVMAVMSHIKCALESGRAKGGTE